MVVGILVFDSYNFLLRPINFSYDNSNFKVTTFEVYFWVQMTSILAYTRTFVAGGWLHYTHHLTGLRLVTIWSHPVIIDNTLRPSSANSTPRPTRHAATNKIACQWTYQLQSSFKCLGEMNFAQYYNTTIKLSTMLFGQQTLLLWVSSIHPFLVKLLNRIHLQ